MGKQGRLGHCSGVALVMQGAWTRVIAVWVEIHWWSLIHMGCLVIQFWFLLVITVQGILLVKITNSFQLTQINIRQKSQSIPLPSKNPFASISLQVYLFFSTPPDFPDPPTLPSGTHKLSNVFFPSFSNWNLDGLWWLFSPGGSFLQKASSSWIQTIRVCSLLRSSLLVSRVGAPSSYCVTDSLRTWVTFFFLTINSVSMLHPPTRQASQPGVCALPGNLCKSLRYI